MYNEKKPVRDYIQNLLLLNLTMGEMIHQLENLVVEENFEDDEKK